jgi:hypothetical protein
MQETSLHSALKDWYARQGGQKEAMVDGYFIDVVQGDLLVEVQTRSFASLRPKLADLLERHAVRLVHPIPLEKWIVYLPADGSTGGTRRKSPRRGRLEHVFRELIRFPGLVRQPNFSLEIVLTREEELRRRDGRGSWRRSGASIVDRRLLAVVDSVVFTTPDDFRRFIPLNLPQPFTNRQLSACLGVSSNLACRMTYCLTAMQVLDRVDKISRSYLYALRPTR